MTKLGVIRTSNDALTSKWSAVATDYFSYPEVEFFVEEKTRRQPLINRGYCLRFEAMTQALATFITAVLSSSLSEPVQIVNLGCGFDPLFFMIEGRLMIQGSHQRLRYYEVDFEEVLRKKAETVRAEPSLAARIGAEEAAPPGDLLRTENYKMLPHDLENPYGVIPGLRKLGLALDGPIFWLTECVLSYISDESADTLHRELMKQCRKYCIFSYEVFNVTDRFGRTMRDNFLRRNCDIKSTARFRSTHEVKSHLTTLCEGKVAVEESPTMLPRDILSRHVAFPTTSLPRVEVVSMDEYYLHHLAPVERFRIEQLELFDELEEWRLIQEHYFVSSVCNIVGIEPLLRKRTGQESKGRMRFDTEELVGVSHENILIKTAQNLIKDEEDNQEFMMTLKTAGIQGWIHRAPQANKSTLFYSAPNFKPSSSSCESMPSNASYHGGNTPPGATSPGATSPGAARQRLKTAHLSALDEEPTPTSPPTTIAELLKARSFF